VGSTQGQPATGTHDYPAEGQQATGYPVESAEGGRPGARNAGVGILIGTVLAGVLMMLSGLYDFLAGLAMIIRGGFFAFQAGYAYVWTPRGWGWTELIVGAVVFAAGVCVLLGMVWARVAGVILATLSAIGNFLVLPYYPVWSVILIAVDVFIIWSLVSRERRSPV
jgi:hypothetical protein